MPRTRRFPRLRRVEPVLRRALRGSCHAPAGSTLLVAVSGGADSTALLVALQSIAPEFGLALHAAHLHHGLRGADADADLEAVRALCERLEVRLTAARIDARRAMARRGWTGEDGLRRLRRAFLARTARATGAAAIATAHTADDQLETLLLRLARGTGLRGLGGMRERSGRRIKPLLEATRADVEADLRRAGLTWREDASNATRAHARNRIRHDVVPALMAATGSDRPGLARRAARAAAEARAAERRIAAGLRRRLSKICRIQGGVLTLASGGVEPYPPAARRLLFGLAWRRLTGGREGLTHRHLEGLGRLLGAGRPARVIGLPGGYRAVRNEGDIVFLPGSKRRTRRPGSSLRQRPERHPHHGGASPS